MKTKKKVIYIGLSLDVLHHGHINLINKASSFGDLIVKIFVALVMLIPFRLLLSHVQENSTIEKKINVYFFFFFQ